MIPAFNWLHFSDLHFGQPDQSALWPNIRKALFEDLKRLHDRAGPWHAVLFSGDMVYSGQSTQFQQFEQEILGRIWEQLTRLGSGDAILLAVPGNHDLQRNTLKTPSAALRQLLRPGGFLEVADEVWNQADSEYTRLLREAFDPYQEWWNKTQFRRSASIKDGIMPGDFAATLVAASRKIGVIGLNTAFLQLSHGNFRGQLEWDPRQLSAVCGDVEDWASNHDVCILMTHHGPQWLSDGATEDYAEICPAGRFATHIFGHMHDNLILASHQGGGGISRKWQSASLFGLEKFGQPPSKMRKHGFIAGRILFEKAEPTIRCWPRAATKDSNGWRCIPDHHRGALESDDGIRSESVDVLADTNASPSSEDELPPPAADESRQELIPIETALAIEPAKQRLRTIPRFRANVDQAHRSVRKEEQAMFEAFARKHRLVCVVSDWGLGKEGFLGCALERLVSPLSKADVFRINCEEVESVEGLLTAVGSQFGMSFQEFCALSAPLVSAFLLLDEIPRQLLQGEEEHRLLRLVASTLDYCPNLCFVVTTRQTPEADDLRSVIALKPLDPFDIRSYLNSHAQAVPNLEDADTLERIETWSGGLPMHLDRLLDLLPVSSLSAILEEDIEYSAIVPTGGEPVPKALEQAVGHLANSGNEYSRRSFRMLKVLTVLAEGETIQSIKRFYPSEPFHLQNVTELMRLSLVESVASSMSAEDLAIQQEGARITDAETQKTLRVPRQVRDFVRTQITDAERTEIVHASTDLLFGRKWREGKIRLRCDLPQFSHTGLTEPGNEHIVIRHLLHEALDKRSNALIKRAAGLGTAYGHK